MPEPAGPAEGNALGAVHSWHVHALETGLLARVVHAYWLLARRAIKRAWTPLYTPTALFLGESVL